MLLSRVRRRGITLVELLVVLAILGLLATIAIPAYINRMDQARKTTAKAECEAIAKSEEMVGESYGFFMPLQLLDNVPNTPGTSPAIPNDDFDDEQLSQLYAIDIAVPILLQDNSGGTSTGQDFYDLRLDSTTNARLLDMITNWSGPFLRPQRVYKGTSNASYPTDSETIRRDYPLDPWGKPYRFFSPIGIIGSNANTDSYDSDQFSNGYLTTNLDRFDRFAILSLGPDGNLDAAGTSTTQKDDIFYLFGPGETVYAPSFFN